MARFGPQWEMLVDQDPLLAASHIHMMVLYGFPLQHHILVQQ
jgi:hypothetical protein